MIIIDDETAVINKIAASIPFDLLGISLKAICENGLEGFDCVKKHFPDIILCDITMPKMSGFELLEQISKFPGYSPQVIILTGHDDIANARLAIKYQVLDYLVKPVLPDELLAVLKRAVVLAEDE